MFHWNIDARIGCHDDAPFFPEPVNAAIKSGKGRNQNVSGASDAPKHTFQIIRRQLSHVMIPVFSFVGEVRWI
jgi:hypothetical protein